MAKATGHVCDRCVGKMSQPSETITVAGATYELCGICSTSLSRFLANEKTYSGKFKSVDYCTHHIPCAGPCESRYVKCQDGEGHR